MKIYIGCALTHVPREKFREYTGFIHELAATLKTSNPPNDVTYALVNSDPQLATKPINERARLCYLWDHDMVKAADLLIAEASFPSIGLGIEMQIAEANGIPIILCFRDYGTNKAKPVVYQNPDLQSHELQIGEGFVTLMALGLCNVFRVLKYVEATDGIKQVMEAIQIAARTQG